MNKKCHLLLTRVESGLGGRPPVLKNVPLPIANRPAKWLYQIQSLPRPTAPPLSPTKQRATGRARSRVSRVALLRPGRALRCLDRDGRRRRRRRLRHRDGGRGPRRGGATRVGDSLEQLLD